MMRATLAAAGLLTAAFCGSARADWRATVDLLHPECRNTPVAQMTRAKIEECDMIERIFRGMDAAIEVEKERHAAKAPPSTWKCQPSADIICERYSTPAAPPRKPLRGGGAGGGG
jgi:hypothetical protein